MSLEHADEFSTSGQSSDTEDPTANSEAESEPRTRAKTFGRAANILRECLGNLGEDGAVAFLNIGTSLNDSRRRRSATSNYGAAAVNGDSHPPATMASFIAYSTEGNNIIPEKGLDEKVKSVDAETLKELVRRYPGGRLFTLDTNASSSSEDDTITSVRRRRSSDQPHKPSRRKQFELDAIRAAFSLCWAGVVHSSMGCNYRLFRLCVFCGVRTGDPLLRRFH